MVVFNVKFIILVFLFLLIPSKLFSISLWNFKFYGNKIFSDEKLKKELENIPDTLLCSSAEKIAASRLRSLYLTNGYDAVEVWVVCIKETKELEIEIDEGKLQKIVFVGVDTLKTALFRLAINLEGDIFHKPSLENQLEPLKKKYKLRKLTYKIKTGNFAEKTEKGNLRYPKELYIYVVSSFSTGIGFSIEHDPAFGLIPLIQYNIHGIFWEDDRIELDAEMAIPYRRYLYDVEPKFQWVHGNAGIKYRLLPLARVIVPSIELDTEVSQYRRLDIGIEKFYNLKAKALLLINLVFSEYFSISVGGGAEQIGIFDDEMISREIPNPVSRKYSYRYIGKFGFEINFKPEPSRLGQKNFISASAMPVFFGKSDDYFIRTIMNIGYYSIMQRFEFLVRTRAVYFLETPPVYDEINLSGTYMKAFFDSKYYISETFQIDTELAMNIYDERIFLGIFGDLSIFYDRHTKNENFVNLATASGPSFHLLFLDSFLFSAHYALGTSLNDSFSHNIYFGLRKIF